MQNQNGVSSAPAPLNVIYSLLIMIIIIIMVILKCLSSKALGALQDHEGEGGTGYQNNYTNVSLRLYIIIHQYINAQSHPLHTLSLSLSLSPSQSTYTHIHHTPHTHRANQAEVS